MMTTHFLDLLGILSFIPSQQGGAVEVGGGIYLPRSLRDSAKGFNRNSGSGTELSRPRRPAKIV